MKPKLTFPGSWNGLRWAKKSLSRRQGKPVAKLVPIKSSRPRFKLGSAKGEFVVPDDFNDPLPKEMEDLFW